MDINPIPYSAFIKKDNSLEELISSLESIKSSYASLQKTITSDAKSIASSMKNVNAASKEGQNQISKVSTETARLTRLNKELKIATSSTGLEISKLKERLADANTQNKLTAKSSQAMSGSLKEHETRLAMLVKQYSEMSTQSRLNSDEARQLTANILNLKGTIKDIKNEIALKTTTEKKDKQSMDASARAAKKLIDAYSQETLELVKVRKQIKEVTQIRTLEDQLANNSIKSYDGLSAAYRLNVINLNKYSQEIIDNSRFLKKQQTDTANMRKQMMMLKEATGDHTLSVGNYRKAWNGLGVATQQVVRELPAMAVSMNTFFLAISNNIPILADEITKMAHANKMAAKSGKETTSVWKQVAKSLLGWQSLMVVGLTLMSMFGGKVMSFIGDLFKAKDAVESLEKAQKNINKEMAENSTGIGKHKILLKEMSAEWTLLGNNINKQKEFIEKNKTSFDSLGVSIETVTDAQKLLVSNTPLVIDALKLQAKAAAAKKLAEDKYEKAAIEEVKAKALEEQGESKWTKIKGALVSAAAQTNLSEHGAGPIYSEDAATADQMSEYFHGKEIKRAEQRQKILEQEGDAYFNLAEAADVAAKAKLEEAGIDESKSNQIQKTKAGPKGASELSIENENLKIRKRYAESITELERDELEKRKMQLIDALDAETAELRNKQKNDEKLTQESRELIDDIVINLKKKLDYDIELLDIEHQQRVLNHEKEGLDLRISLMDRGTTEYYAVRNQLLRNQMEHEILENKKLIVTMQKDEQAIRNKYGYDILQNEIAMDDLFFDQAQRYQESEFNLIRRSEYQKNKFILEQEKEMWVRRLEMARAGLLQLSDLEISTIENTLKILERQMNDLDSSRDIFDLIGLNLGREQKAAIDEATGYIKGQIGAMIDAEIQLADVKLEKAKEQVDNAFGFLQMEMEARNQGYADNVETASKELELAKEKEAKVLKQKKKAQLAQERLNTLEQTSSLITASANIWKTFSALGPFGIPLAVSTIALMFGSFIGAKVKARQVINAESEEYADGHVELLEGGSHASGKDIPLGTTKKGKQRKAEGGEVFAVINKRNVGKYGKDKIFDVVNSINKGIFEDKYTNVFNPATFDVRTNSVDLLDLDSNVKAIKEQNEYKYHSDSRGLLVEKYKNRTRVFK